MHAQGTRTDVPASVTSDLLSPSLQEHVPRARDAAKPWRLGSQVYVAFFGGVLAATLIAVLNARRLRMPRRETLKILAAAALGLVGLEVLAYVVGSADETGQGVRVAMRVLALAAWGLMYLVQRPYDRVYSAFSREDEDEEYSSLIIPGLLAAIVLGLVEIGLFFVIASGASA